MNLRFGILGCSAFAGRTMIPAMREAARVEAAAVASRDAAKAAAFAERFGLAAVNGYDALLARKDVDAVYIPLPPALLAAWAERALDAGKHVLVEKPLARQAGVAARLAERARSRGLLLMEDIVFPYHSQFAWVRDFLGRGEIGVPRLFRTTFTVPPFQPDNVRYRADLGGGALMDLGPYMVRFVHEFLGPSAALRDAFARRDAARAIDLSGVATYTNECGQAAQVAYGFDTHYQCIWEILGSAGKLTLERAYTAPPGHTPVVRIGRGSAREEVTLAADHQYRNLCECFAQTALDRLPFEPYLAQLQAQARGLEELDRASARAMAGTAA